MQRRTYRTTERGVTIPLSVTPGPGVELIVSVEASVQISMPKARKLMSFILYPNRVQGYLNVMEGHMSVHQ